MPRQRLPRLCSNLKCQVVETPLWRRGWRKNDGTFARLCNSCGLHYRKGHYCEHCLQLYKEQDEFDDSWISCTSCARYSHKDCIKAARGSSVDMKKYTCSECSGTTVKHTKGVDCIDCADDCVRDSENEESSVVTLRKRKISVTTFEVQSNPAKRTRGQTTENKKKNGTTPTSSISENASAKVKQEKQAFVLSDCNYAPANSCSAKTKTTTTTVVMRRKSVSSTELLASLSQLTKDTVDPNSSKSTELLKEKVPADPSLAGFNVLWAVCEMELSKMART